MQKQTYTRPSSGAKAVAIDPSPMLAKLRLAQLLTLIAGAVTALGLHFIFAR